MHTVTVDNTVNSVCEEDKFMLEIECIGKMEKENNASICFEFVSTSTNA